MGSSGGGDYGPPPRGPAPPANLISPQGSSVPYTPHFINFLGDTNTPATGLTPDMLTAINAMNGPATPPAAAGGGYDSQIADLRNQLAAMQAAQQQKPKPPPIYRGGEGSAGGRGGSAGGGGWGGH